MRVFAVPEPVGPWVTVLVYLPRDRFTAELPEQVADLVAAAYDADRRTFEADIGASTLARHRGQRARAADDAGPVDADALERAIDELSTSWADRLRAALVAELGEGHGRELFDRVGADAPAAYVAAVTPERAIGDVRRIADLVASGRRAVDGVRSRGRRGGRGSGASACTDAARRRRCPSCCRCSTSSALRALDERPYTFRVGDERVHLYDIGVKRRRHDGSRRAASRRPAGRLRPARRRQHRERRLQPPRAAGRSQRS